MRFRASYFSGRPNVGSERLGLITKEELPGLVDKGITQIDVKVYGQDSSIRILFPNQVIQGVFGGKNHTRRCMCPF